MNSNDDPRSSFSAAIASGPRRWRKYDSSQQYQVNILADDEVASRHKVCLSEAERF